jgi:outer membrane protein OmpA-like peptidoglycan-associated protein
MTAAGAPGASGDSTQPSAVLALRRINFIVDTPVPTDSTRRILPEFIRELRQFKDHHLEIDGYVNSIVPLHGPDDPLFKLSVNRAKFIYDCLVEAGFDPGKLTYKGMGNASPINPHPTTKQEMNANMRVEIRVY